MQDREINCSIDLDQVRPIAAVANAVHVVRVWNISIVERWSQLLIPKTSAVVFRGSSNPIQ
jgi:hypothetical protein